MGNESTEKFWRPNTSRELSVIHEDDFTFEVNENKKGNKESDIKEIFQKYNICKSY